ncbi:type II toxin-antitoxin system RelE/ParE family toxin [Algoriphagus aquimarinus]|uniref:type II toxin-antitoxin system RelE/ParE family toxin n=1 Tax=Algoriphagus aquimarinus TaxID=237018 RepID=UPI0030DBE5C5|tara:strand:- start:4422 stop:4724 length:303 start_codon:yes stop_codon:yes gene_type:complete
MPYNYQLSEEAESDVYDSYIWYEKQQKGLGEYFLESIDAAAQAICNNPKTYQIRYKKKVRSFVVSHFPYLILYVVNGDNIDVIAVFNTNRHPKRLKKRIE